MTLLAHLVRADVRRFGVPLTGWVLLQIADTIFRGARPALATDMRLATMFELLGTVLLATRLLGMIVIVALVVQTHALVGSDGFWMTRPIHWRTLLASKLVLLGTTFVVVPILCDVGLMLASRISVSDIPPIALQTALFQCLWLFLFMALAAVTRNLARLALVAGSLLVGLMLLFNIMIAMMLRSMPDGPQLSLVTPRALPNPAGGVALLILLIAVAIASVAVQYRTRLVRAAILACTVGLGASVLILLTWPWQTRLVPLPAWATTDTALRLESTSPQAEFRPLDEGHPWSSTGAWRMGSLPLEAGEVEDGWLAMARLDTATVSFGDSTTLATAGNNYSSPVRVASTGVAPHDAVVRQVLGVTRLLETTPEFMRGMSTPAIIVTQGDFEKYKGVTGTYRGQFMVDLDRVVVASTLPLQTGAVFQGHRDRMLIDQVSAHGPTASVRLRQFTSSSIFDADERPRMAFYLRNRAAAEAVAGSSLGGMALSRGIGLPLLVGGLSAESESGFHVTSSTVRFPAGYGADGRMVELSAEWLSQAELVIVHTISGGSVTRTVEVPGFRMIAAPPRRDTAIGARR